MIVTCIHGGLGNQMFQYAAGRRAALLRSVPLGIDLSEMKRYRKRSYGLDQFVLAPDALPVDGAAFSSGRGVVRIWRKWRNQYRDREETGFAFDPEVLNLLPPARLVGYWQSEKYFSDVGDTIRAEFELARPMTDRRLHILREIRLCESISVHVRRGDYVSVPRNAEIFGTCSSGWYERAVSIASEGVKNPVFFVFSDDIPWAAENLVLPGRVVWVEPSDDGRDAEDLHLMAACGSHVIANSSFSWWGAWLDRRKEARVVAPAKWFQSNELDARDLVPDRWIRI